MLTNAQFSAKIGAITKSAKAARANVQVCTLDAFEAISGDAPDLTRLTRLRRAVEGTHGLNAAKLIGYIAEHVGNIAWAKQKDGTKGYKKATKGEAIEVTMPDDDYRWWDWKPEPAAPTPFDFAGALKRAAKKAHAEGIVETPEELQAYIAGMIQRGELERAFADEATPVSKAA